MVKALCAYAERCPEFFCVGTVRKYRGRPESFRRTPTAATEAQRLDPLSASDKECQHEVKHGTD
eukprot:SM000064S19764  [mRNA]  locus=s64:304619:305161:- [translate_table: standard]